MMVWKHEGSGEYTVKSGIEAVCPLCKAGLEDSNHLLWSCGILQSVWDSLQIKPPVFEEQLCGKQHFASTFSSANDQQKRVMIISIWSLWYRRNKLVHEGVKLSFQELIGFIKGYDQELSLSQERLGMSQRSMVNELWRPPEAGVIKLNFDAAFQKDQSISVIAVIARDSSREIIGLGTYLFIDVCDACVAEAWACERALRFASSHALDGRSTAIVLWGLVWEYTEICKDFGHERPVGLVSSVRFCLDFALNSVLNHRMSVLDSKLRISSHLPGFDHKGEVERFDG
ncbi:hypothetical protein J1N35_023686 [Gossypium stocksii]|uniref:RNase H type-1 domain-containing protein n=1 Tax=Gossypium stocksii TaxID=47602 RepID=A0A9D3VIM2_9ROSI|nr:hypothetical protein J1N35_023686 [Gossypium stocksii]